MAKKPECYFSADKQEGSAIRRYFCMLESGHDDKHMLTEGVTVGRALEVPAGPQSDQRAQDSISRIGEGHNSLPILNRFNPDPLAAPASQPAQGDSTALRRANRLLSEVYAEFVQYFKQLVADEDAANGRLGE